jgi:CheY-like chemotaxis protein/two-component sensor histidine kinase
LRLLNDILDLAKVESGTVTLAISRLTLVELQDALQRDFGHVAEAKGLAFAVELAPGLPPTIETDSGRLRQVLTNLLSNAFKFTAGGEVRVLVSQAETGWSQANDTLARAPAVISISISDTGIGIVPELQRRIFEAFAQADGTTARQYGGTGLGLSISRELVRLLGGEITLSSTLDEGSTFTVYLPSVLASPVTSVAPTEAEPRSAPLLVGAGGAGRKVLIVDDDFRNIFALTTLLQRSNFVVLSAESGEEGVTLLSRTPDVDIVLVDIMMPVMDGYATIRAMHELPSRAALPIVAVTANVAADTRRRCIDAGACAYVAKPVESADLMFVLSEWLPAFSADGRRAKVLA